MMESSSTSAENSMVSYVGQMEAFDPNEGEWSTYVELLEMFFAVNNVPEDKKSTQFNCHDGKKVVYFDEEFNNPDKTDGVIVQGNYGNYGVALA